MKYLITGANGQLAKEFAIHLEKNGQEFLAATRDKLDVCNLNNVRDVIESYKPSVVLNCAAYNYVDLAETDYLNAFKINALALHNLSFACKKQNIFLVHYSTDYVFDGEKNDYYIEEDPANPLNIYGKTKLIGEKLINSGLQDYLIFRVSWLYGRGKNNFLSKILLWSKEMNTLRIAYDEFSIPTSTRFIAENTLKAINCGIKGTYHLTPRGYASRCEIAKVFLNLVGVNKFVLPVSSKVFNTPAVRPKFSAMSSKKISQLLNVDFPAWDEELKQTYQEYFK